MAVLTAILAACVVLGLLFWLWTLYGAVRLWCGLPRLGELELPAPKPWPRLSVIVPARNEQDDLPGALDSLLAQDYGDLEILLVDDRSGDRTGQIMDRAAGRDARARVIHLTELPEGWLGKVHALHAGYRASTGSLVLFTDADVHFRPGALGRAVALCERDGLDHLALAPHLWRAGFAVDAAVSAFLRQLVIGKRAWRAGDPRSRAYMGVGAFNLVRRSALERTAGLEHLRMEVADDMGLAMMLKRAGLRSCFANGVDCVGLYWHRSLRSIARGAEKGFATLSRFSLLRTVLLVGLTGLLETAPWLSPLALLWRPARWVGLVGLATAVCFLAAVLLLQRQFRRPVLSGLATPVAAGLMAWAFVGSAVRAARRGSIDWRGTRYAPEPLRTGCRVRFP